MGLAHSPRIVTDGLVLALDAGNTKSYGAGVESTGQAEYTSSGSYSWTCPPNVTSVSVVCVGGGAGGPGSTWDGDESGGGGGGLGYKNNISVTAGQSYTVVVGSGGVGPQNGGDSYFINTTTVKGGGGSYGYQGNTAPGGTYVGDGGGNGGDGGDTDGQSAAYGGGGGGAGGYSGKGGDGSNAREGSQYILNGPGQDGSGGGGGGGSTHHGGSGGGGVGIYGEGPSGAGDQSVSPDTTYGGRGGSGGSPGTNGAGGSSPYNGGDGGAYGGGAGGGSDGNRPDSTGGGGAVRIIWGSGRSFPSTLTSNQPTTSGSGGGGGPNVWKDKSVNGNNGTISSATHTSGVGGYFDFDGSNDYVSHSNDSFVSNGGATLECWFNADTGSALRSLINHSGFTYFNLVRDSSNKIRLEYKSTSQNNTQLLSTSTISTGSWYHVVGVVNSTGARIYINGELDASNNTPQNLGTVSSTLYIGGYSSGSTYRFDGKIAVAKRYDKPLTASEIKQNFNALRGRYGV